MGGGCGGLQPQPILLSGKTYFKREKKIHELLLHLPARTVYAIYEIMQMILKTKH